jgi:hypothetical protein
LDVSKIVGLIVIVLVQDLLLGKVDRPLVDEVQKLICASAKVDLDSRKLVLNLAFIDAGK